MPEASHYRKAPGQNTVACAMEGRSHIRPLPSSTTSKLNHLLIPSFGCFRGASCCVACLKLASLQESPSCTTARLPSFRRAIHSGPRLGARMRIDDANDGARRPGHAQLDQMADSTCSSPLKVSSPFFLPKGKLFQRHQPQLCCLQIGFRPRRRGSTCHPAQHAGAGPGTIKGSR